MFLEYLITCGNYQIKDKKTQFSSTSIHTYIYLFSQIVCNISKYYFIGFIDIFIAMEAFWPPSASWPDDRADQKAVKDIIFNATGQEKGCFPIWSRCI